ncbi:hypothetical protein KNP414_06385 [Paenibacillus mucilaginosus KNP414]|uniref:Uncharacterized protein n=1 Tax=Paenibacillus mucilaginosus (strain KNP414) TaxID=1036673 RepID=F8FMU6_PAEMK|nr:hypothetical protein KNP414_06385 [Paenibacillus mucilaginosus KNP414]
MLYNPYICFPLYTGRAQAPKRKKFSTICHGISPIIEGFMLP